MKKLSLFDSIEIKSPCGQDWDSMRGTDAIRFCDHCAKSVNNISAIRHKDFRKLIARSESQICVRIVRRPDGTIETLRNRLHQITRHSGIAAGILGTTMTMSAFSYAQNYSHTSNIEESAVAASVTEAASDGNEVSGVVTDQNGAVINFALAAICMEGSGTCYTAPTDSAGRFEFKNILEGKYILNIEATGFSKTASAAFFVSPNSSSQHNFQMSVERVQEQVQVGGQTDTYHTVVLGGAISMTVNYVSNNALIRAAQADDMDEAARLIASGKKVNVRNKHDGNSPLHYAVENGNLEMTMLLLNAGAKVNIKNHEKQTPLMLIDEDATADMVNVLLRFGAALNVVDKERNSVLILAAGRTEEDVLKTLILNGADVNARSKQGRTALMSAVDEGDLESVKLLLESGARADAADKSGATAISLTSDVDIQQLLLSYGALPVTVTEK